MKVKDLIDTFAALDPDAEVVLAKDGEGNSFSPSDAFSVGEYVTDSPWRGEFYTDMDIKARNEDYDEGLNAGAVRAVALWPVN